MSISTVAQNAEGTLEYKLYFEKDGKRLSPWHDLPLTGTGGSFGGIIEIPRGTTAKMEVSKSDELNPIKQDVKNGKLRQVTYQGGYPWNYGMIPQTYEDPNVTDAWTSCKGDNDPLDICEISGTPLPRGSAIEVKVLGCLGLIDEGEMDWKIICINAADARAAALNDIGDVEAAFPGLLKTTHEWFRDYKTVDGKPQNKFAFDGQFKDRAFALKVIDEAHHCWKNLVEKKSIVPNVWTPKL